MPNLVDTFSNIGEGTVGTDQLVNGSIINTDVSGAAALQLTKLENITAGSVLMGNANNVPTATVISGDITVSSNGVTSIGSGVIVDADINGAAAIDKTKISGTAITAADTGTVTSTMIADSTIVNGDISASAGITLGKLATSTAGNIIVYNGSGIPTSVTVSGDVQIDSAGIASITANSVALGTDTTGDYVATITGGTGVASTAATSGEGTTHTLSIGQAVGTTDNVTFAGVTADNIKVGVTGANEIDTVSGDLTIDSAGGTVTVDDNLTVTGNLTVSGTTTTINTTNLSIADNQVVLNSDVTGAPSEDAGIVVERGTSPDVDIRWNETTDKWQLTNDGTNYANILVAGDSGAVTSAMIADGAIVNADINDTAAIALSKLASSTAGNIIVYNASGVPTSVTETGDVTISDTGVASIAAGAIVNADVSDTAAIALNKIADISTNAQTATYTLVLADKNKIVEMNVATGNTLNVPPNSSVAWPVGTQINILQTGAGQTSIVAAAGVTINATPGLKLRAQYSYATLIKRAENTWVAVGDLSA